MNQTIEDVARLAGVSRSTVSRVLNGSPRVSPATRDAVLRAVRESGYQLNAHARSLASGRTHAVAMLLTQPSDELFDDPTFRELVRGVSEGFGDSSDALLLLLAGSEVERRRTERFLSRQRIDGVVHLTPHTTDPLLDRIVDAGLPATVCGRLLQPTTSPLLRTVTVEDGAGGRAAAEHLVACGATRIGMVAGPVDAAGSIERLEGFRSALGDRFDPELVRHGDYGTASGLAAAGELLDAHTDVDALFCASDRMAAGAYWAAHDRGLRIPEDLQVVGFDGHPLGLELRPTLTTVRQPIQRLGQAAITMLRELIEGEDPGHRVFSTELVVRGSTRS
mgnify:CR=1 FL=1